MQRLSRTVSIGRSSLDGPQSEIAHLAHFGVGADVQTKIDMPRACGVLGENAPKSELALNVARGHSSEHEIAYGRGGGGFLVDYLRKSIILCLTSADRPAASYEIGG